MIVERLPESILTFLTKVELLGFVVTLVGGTPRDFLFADTIGHDLDFEIRVDCDISPSDWPQTYQRFLDFLKTEKIPHKILPYLITRVELGAYQLEFSSPRLEKNLEDNFSHHHFEAVLDSNLSYQDSFKRRDFTINAIGFKLNVRNVHDELIDPYGGVSDLKSGILKPVGEDFYHDSVRFLRLLRFQIKFHRFVMDADLMKSLQSFNLTKLSSHYFKEEMFKSSAGKFLNLFQKLVSDHKLIYPPEFALWTKYNFSPELTTKEEILGFVFLQNKSDAALVANFFNMPAKTLRDLESFFQSYQMLSATRAEQLKILSNQSAVEALGDVFFKEAKNFEEKKIWLKHLHLANKELALGPDDWEKILVTSDELKLCPPALRSYLPYLKALKKKYSHD